MSIKGLKNVNNCDNIKLCKIIFKKLTKFENDDTISKTKSRLLKCVWPQCRYSSKRKDSLRYHILSHTEGDKFKCDFIGCKTSYKHKKNFNNHKKIHLGKKIYVFGLNVSSRVYIELLL